LKVDVSAGEALAIAEHVKSRLSKMQVAGVLKVAEENAAILRPLSEQERQTANLKCPFLADERCIVYPVRPEKCRSYHSTDVRVCEKSYAEPLNMEIPKACIEGYFYAGEGHAQGFSLAVAEAGYDAAVYELNAAFVEAMAGPSPLKRFRKRKRTFLNGGGAAAPKPDLSAG
jgi:Fe-S-cluster containining protein